MILGIEFSISSHNANKYAKSKLNSSSDLPSPLVLTIALIFSGIFNLSRIFFIWSLSSPPILLDIPPDLLEFGMSTKNLPAKPTWEVRAAPFVPLSSFVTWTTISCPSSKVQINLPFLSFL